MEASQTVIPFKYHGNSIRPDLNNCHRLKLYRRFIGGKMIGLYSLDIGESGYISRGLEVTDNTLESDFNFYVAAPGDAYEVITCFEVINHVMNPLHLMIDIHGFLKPGGRCYLSTPKLWLIPWHHCRHNFVNYNPDRLEVLFRYAGFEVIRRKTVNPWPFRFVFYGIRPVFRFLLNRIVIWELRKP